MDLSLLKKLGELKSFNANDFVFLEGDLGANMYILVKGKVGVYINSFMDEPFIVNELKTGSFFGEMALIDNMPRSASIIALEDGTLVLEINKENFDKLIVEDMELSYRILRTLCERAKSTIEKLPENKKHILKNYERDEYYKLIPVYNKDIFQALSNFDKNNIVELSKYISLLIRKLDEELIDTEEDKKSAIIINNMDFIPKQHKTYDYEIEENFQDLMLKRKMKCPVCGHEFEQTQPKFRSARIIKIEDDMRKICKPYKPEWYNITTCPQCLYSEYSSDFNKLSKIYVEDAKKVLEKVKTLRGTLKFHKLNINTIFMQYYIAMMCAVSPKMRSFKMARSWLVLSWLYKDVNHEEMYEYAYDQAFKYYTDVFQSSVNAIPEEEEQKLYVILGELNKRKGNYDEALKLLFDAAQFKGGNKQIGDMARNIMADVRELKRNMN